MTSPTAVDDTDGLAPRHDVPTSGRSGFCVVDGRQVHFLEWGHRGLPPVLCLHGGGQTAYMYEELGAALRDRYHLLAPDLPNHGDSDPTPDGEWGRQSLGATIPPLLDEFGFDRAVFIGASLGGMTSITLGATHPERMAALVLIDVGHRLEEEGVLKIIEFMRAHESFASLEEAATEIAPYLPNRRAVRVESLSRNLRQRDDGRWAWKHNLGRRWEKQVEAVGGDEDDLDWRRVLDGLEAEARSIAVPALVLRGARSDVLSDEGAEEIAAAIPDCRLETVERAGHLAAGDNPNSTVRLISAFLTEIGW